ncbi:MAG: hypothetical protein E5V92_07815 [Mesorhizobium sp.]|nr:MAG: hypothetical protein E5V92_07815 [Mesorhizobium sp.]
MGEPRIRRCSADAFRQTEGFGVARVLYATGPVVTTQVGRRDSTPPLSCRTSPPQGGRLALARGFANLRRELA